MSFQKGIEKKGGRTKGTPNNNTKLIKDRFEEIINSFDNESIIEDLQYLRPIERLKILLAMSEFIAPKMQRETITLNTNVVEQPLFSDDVLWELK
jgi:hypothetical protein